MNEMMAKACGALQDAWDESDLPPLQFSVFEEQLLMRAVIAAIRAPIMNKAQEKTIHLPHYNDFDRGCAEGRHSFLLDLNALFAEAMK